MKMRAQVPSAEAYREEVQNAYEEGWSCVGSGETGETFMSSTFRTLEGDEVRIVYDPHHLDHRRDPDEVEAPFASALFNRVLEAAQAARAFVEDMKSRGVMSIDDEAVRYHLARLLKSRSVPLRSTAGGGT